MDTLEVVDIDLADLGPLGRPPFAGRPAFVVVSLDGDLLGACVVPPVAGEEELIAEVARRLGDTVRARAVAAAIGDRSAWRRAPHAGPPVTVVVCTAGRPEVLRRGLEVLVRLARDRDEILVVDNTVEGSARAVTEDAGARWVHETRPGSSWARNRGAAEARHNVVAYIDDDCVPDRAWLEAIRAPFADPDVDGVTGGVLARRVDLLVPRFVDRRYPFHRGWSPRCTRGTTGGSASPYDAWRLGTGASMAWRRELLDRLGGFDPALGAGTRQCGGDDLDLFRRVVDAGATIAYRPDALVFHEHPDTWAGLRRKLVGYSVAEGAHLAKVMIEEGRRRAALVVLGEYRWRLRHLPGDVAAVLTGRPRLPVVATAVHLPAVAVGATRFLRHRSRLRAA